MITCFSFKLNGWVNYNRPHAPTAATVARGRANCFPLVSEAGFAYAHKEHAEANMMPHASLRAIPFAWAKHMPKPVHMDD